MLVFSGKILQTGSGDPARASLAGRV